ncbi:Bax inhibitor-1/YccA family protein [Mobilicoccus sp.]|uniref:Bax inhibitor-1/YccA family protein n=1 Tax=Mobilicoccus sp. TaxID=2034349 RepID=UPI00289843A3|nr:Bax inhibitor-1/YccA family protein [Mobilicoccus sp.]
MSNPVFNRIDEQSRRGYAGFGDNRSTQYYGSPQTSQGYPQDHQSAGRTNMSAGQLDDLYNSPSASPTQSRRLTLDDVMMKSGLLFGLMLVVAGITWTAGLTINLGIAGLASITGAIVTLVLGMVISFKKTVSPPLILLFTVFEGLMVGGISATFMVRFDGVVTTAVIATLCVFATMFLGWKTKLIRVTERSRRIVGMAIVGYMLFMLVNFVAALFGMNQGWGVFGLGSGMSILVSVFAVGLASYSLAMDFDSIEKAIQAGAPEKYSWMLAFGLLVTVVWLYIELLRLFANLQSRD